MRQAMRSNAADDRSGLEKAEAIVDAPFRVVKLGGKILILLLVVVVIAAAVWFFLLRDSGSSSPQPQTTVTGQKTVNADGSSKTSAPSTSDSDSAGVASSVTADQWRVAEQIMYLEQAVSQCQNSPEGLKLSMHDQLSTLAAQCQNPDTLIPGGYSLGDGPDQVRVQMTIKTETTKKPHQVTFASGKKQTLTKTSSQQVLTPTFLGVTHDPFNGTLTATPSQDQSVYNDDGDIAFMISSSSCPPNTSYDAATECLAQVIQVKNGTPYQYDTHTARVSHSKAAAAEYDQ